MKKKEREEVAKQKAEKTVQRKKEAAKKRELAAKRREEATKKKVVAQLRKAKGLQRRSSVRSAAKRSKTVSDDKSNDKEHASSLVNDHGEEDETVRCSSCSCTIRMETNSSSPSFIQER